MLRLAGLIQDPGAAHAVIALWLQAPPTAADDIVGFSGAALAVVGSLLSILSGVVLHQTRALDNERAKVLEAQGQRLADRDRTIEAMEERIASLEETVARKDEQIFRILGMAEGFAGTAESLAPLAPLAGRAGPGRR